MGRVQSKLTAKSRQEFMMLLEPWSILDGMIGVRGAGSIDARINRRVLAAIFGTMIQEHNRAISQRHVMMSHVPTNDPKSQSETIFMIVIEIFIDVGYIAIAVTSQSLSQCFKHQPAAYHIPMPMRNDRILDGCPSWPLPSDTHLIHLILLNTEPKTSNP